VNLPESAKKATMSNKTILFVEDDPVSLALYQEGLEREGYRIESVPDGLAAVKVLAGRAPDLVVLDLGLPKLSGVHVLKFMQADPRLTTVPVIIFSNSAMTEVPSDSPLAQGTRRLLKSNCSVSVLLQTINDSLAAAPEFVVVEAATAATAASASSAPDSRRARPVTQVASPAPVAPSTEQLAASVPTTGSQDMADSAVMFSPEEVLQQKAARCSQLEEEVARLFKVRDDLKKKLTDEQQALAKSQQEVKDLQERMSKGGPDGEKHAAERKRLSDLLEAAKSAAQKSDPALKEKESRCKELENDIAGLQKTQQEFQAKLAAGEQEVARSQQENKDLQERLAKAGSELQQARAELQKQTAEKARLEAEAQKQTGTARESAEMTEAMLKEKKAKCAELESQVADLQKARDDAQAKFAAEQKAGARTQQDLIALQKQLQERGAELEKAAILLQKESADRCRLENELREQLAAAKAAAAKSESVLKERDAQVKDKEARAAQLEKELAALQKARDEYQGKLSVEVQTAAKSAQDLKDLQKQLQDRSAELERAKSALQQQTAERGRLESELATAKTASAKLEAGLKEKEARIGQAEKDLAAAQKARDEFQSKLAAEQQATAKSQQEARELQKQVEAGKAGVQKLEGELREQLKAAQTAANQAQAGVKEKDGRIAQVEKELAEARQGRDDFKAKLATEQETAKKTLTEYQQAQKRFHQNTVEMEFLKAGLEKQSAEWTNKEAAWQEQINTAKAATAKTETSLKEKEARCVQLDKEVAGLRQVRDDLQAKLAAEQQTTGKLQQELKALQKQFQDRGVELETTKTSLQQQTTERKRLGEQLATTTASAAQTDAALKEKIARCSQLETELGGLRKNFEELQVKFAAELEAHTKAQNEGKELQKKLRKTAGDLEKTKASLDQQTEEKTRLEADYRNVAAMKESLGSELTRVRENQSSREADLRDKQKRLVTALSESLSRLQGSLHEVESLHSTNGNGHHKTEAPAREMAPASTPKTPATKAN
jgi:chromosome segregation ATPase